MCDFSTCFEIRLPKNLKNLNKDYTIAAAYSDELGLLQNLRQLDPPCPWDEMTCAAASMNGHLDILQWAIKNGCPWDTNTFIYAVMNGHLHILKWISTQNSDWTNISISFICQIASNNGHQHVLQWLSKQYYLRY